MVFLIVGGGANMKAVEKQHKDLRNNMIYSTIFFALVLSLWIGFLFAPQPDMVELPTTNGTYDLTDHRFEDTLYRVPSSAWQSLTYQLYTPEDFRLGNVTQPLRSLGQAESMNTSYATHIIQLKLPADTYYGISMMTAEYAMRIFIDGNEIDSVGVPGTTRESTEHRILERTYYFSPENETTTILVQTANFVHKEGSGAPNFIIGTTQNIVERNNVALSVSFLIAGCLIAAFLHHVGLFFLNRNRKIEFIFAVCCLLLAVMNKKLFLMFVPDYTFALGIRLEYAVLFFTCALFVLFLEGLHPKLMGKYITRGYYALSGAYLLTLLLDIRIFTRLIIGFQIVCLLMIGYIFVRLAMSLREGKLQNHLSFAGMLILGGLAINDILYHQNIVIIPPIHGHFFMAPIGMVFFVFCYSLAMSVGHAETEKAMLEARESERQLANENATLDHMNILKEKLMSTISHEARTPLAILSSYAGLVAMELKDKGMDRQTTADLDTIAFEAKRVANLIDSMKNMTASKEQVMERVEVDLGELMKQTANLYMPILERGNITLRLQIAPSLPRVFGNPAELTQVLFNLLQNAKNHTNAGSVTISVTASENLVTTYIEDTGVGIKPELLPDIFGRGVKGGDTGSGIGLAICQDIVNAHGGTIKIESKQQQGTTVMFTLPIAKEESENG